MTPQIDVRRARLREADVIARFVNEARPGGAKVSAADVAERFGAVGFMCAEYNGQIVGLLGWQVENLVVRVTDFLIAPAIDRVVAGRALISAMEEEGRQLEAEAAILFLPPRPSPELIKFWELFGYQKREVSSLSKAWREAALEWRPGTKEVMVKQLRERLINRPM